MTSHARRARPPGTGHGGPVAGPRPAPGERALLLYPPGLEFIAAFFGCLYAGVVAVPAYLPRLNRPMTRLRSIVVDAQPCAVLTCACSEQGRRAVGGGRAGAPGRATGSSRTMTTATSNELAGRWNDPGATARHARLPPVHLGLHSGAQGRDDHPRQPAPQLRPDPGTASARRPESRGVFWLPLFHDMGLIGGVIQTLYCGGASTLFSPVSFLQRPMRWLQDDFSRTGRSISGAPNFAYELCVEKTTPEQRAGLDLSCWRVAFNGAEPVRPETLDRFADAFAPAGFRREAFLPCYGLAEATLLVSGGPAGQPPVVLSVDARALGRGEIVEADTSRPGQAAGRQRPGRRRPSRRRSSTPRPASRAPTIASARSGSRARASRRATGGDPRRRSDVFGATLDDRRRRRSSAPATWASCKDGELFVTGRLKDMIILRGRNIYPQDIEWTAERCHPALRPAAPRPSRSRSTARSGWRSSRRSSGIAIRRRSPRSSRRSAARSPSSTTSRSTRSG